MPVAILKELSATEDNFYAGYINSDYLLKMTIEDINSEQEKYFNLEGRTCWLENIDNITEAKDVEEYVPWFLECNPKRYPYWYGEIEPRNENLFKSLGSVRKSLQTVEQTYWEKRQDIPKLFSHATKPTKEKSLMECNGEIYF